MMGYIRFLQDMTIVRKIKFTTIRLQTADKKAFEKWLTENRDDYYDIKATLIASGYKFNMSYDPDKDCVMVSMTGTNNTSYNSNLCVTSRSNDPFEAEMLALYKHFVIAKQGDWEDVATELDNWG